jgi:hypothetical protein
MSGFGYYVVAVKISLREVSVAYPVCEKHVRAARFAEFLMSRSALKLVCGVVWIFATMGAVGSVMSLIWAFQLTSISAVCLVVSIGGIVAANIGLKNAPLRIAALRRASMDIEVHSDIFAKEVGRLNPGSVVPMIDTRRGWAVQGESEHH